MVWFLVAVGALWAFVAFRSFRIVVGILAVIVAGVIVVAKGTNTKCLFCNQTDQPKQTEVSEQEQQEACRRWKESYDRGDDDAPPGTVLACYYGHHSRNSGQ